MHHKPLMIDQIYVLDGRAGHAFAAEPFDSCSGQPPPPLHHFAEVMHRKRLTMDQNPLPEL